MHRLILILSVAPFGAPAQEYIHGDECLFCHRNDIGARWQANAHATTVRRHEEGSFSLGPRKLRQSGYGRFAILEDGGWNETKFAERCAGCHSTLVDPKTRTFAAFGLDCYVCHSEATLDHTADTAKMWLSKKRRSDDQLVNATCAQCHLRGSTWQTTGLPYPAGFVAGRDRLDLVELRGEDPHIVRTLRTDGMTCLSCHSVHGNSTAKHRLVLTSAACLDCHEPSGPKKIVRKSRPEHSPTCEY